MRASRDLAWRRSRLAPSEEMIVATTPAEKAIDRGRSGWVIAKNENTAIPERVPQGNHHTPSLGLGVHVTSHSQYSSPFTTQARSRTIEVGSPCTRTGTMAILPLDDSQVCAAQAFR